MARGELPPFAAGKHSPPAAFQRRTKGKRCFIIGNGSSLRQIDLTLLKNEFTFGMNRIYLMFPELGFSTTYFLTVNSLVIEQCAEDIRGTVHSEIPFLAIVFPLIEPVERFNCFYIPLIPAELLGCPRPPLGRRNSHLCCSAICLLTWFCR